MTREELIKNLRYTMKKHENDRVDTFSTNISLMCKDMLDYLKQEPCSDAVSRQAVKDWFCTNYCSEHNKCEHFEKGDCNAMNELFAIPPVNPQPKTGHWINSNIPNEEYVCSECGGACWYYDYQANMAKSKFCPNCGAGMESEE